MKTIKFKNIKMMVTKKIIFFQKTMIFLMKESNINNKKIENNKKKDVIPLLKNKKTKKEEIRQKSFDDHKNENSKMLINKSQNEIDCLSYNRIMTLIDEKLKNIRNNEQNYIGNIFDRKILNRNTILPRSNSDLNCRLMNQDMNFYNNEPRKMISGHTK